MKDYKKKRESFIYIYSTLGNVGLVLSIKWKNHLAIQLKDALIPSFLLMKVRGYYIP